MRNIWAYMRWDSPKMAHLNIAGIEFGRRFEVDGKVVICSRQGGSNQICGSSYLGVFYVLFLITRSTLHECHIDHKAVLMG